MDEEIKKLETELQNRKNGEIKDGEVIEEKSETKPEVEKKPKVNFGEYEFVLCIKKTWLAIVLSIFMYCGLALVPILIALITH